MNFFKYDWKKLGLELLVVFLGVTAGFVLNNWRMNSQESNLRQKYLTGFHQDVTANITELEAGIHDDSLWLERAKPLLLSIQDKTITQDSAKAVMQMIIRISKINDHTGTYIAITNSGNLNLINNFQLKSQLVDYHMAIEGADFVEDYFYDYFNEFVMPFIFEEFSILSGAFRKSGVIRSVRFSNVFAGYFSMKQQRLAAYQELLGKSVALRNVLVREL